MGKRTLVWVVLAMVLGGMWACASGPSPVAVGVPEAKVGTLEVFTSGADGFDTHSYYYDTGQEVVVFGAQFTPGLAKQVVAHIQARTASPIRYLVLTHPNPDKFNGARVFQALGAKVVASEALISVGVFRK